MRSRYRKILVAAGAALASMALLAAAAQAAPPAPPYQDFAGCPSEAENQFIASCEKFEITGGHLTLGKRVVPVTNPIVLRGGFEQETGNFVFNSEGGIVPVRQTVPGGLIGLTGMKWLDSLSAGALKLYATVELAGQPGSVFEPVAVLPIKVHLENQVLGKSCYVGTNQNPIVLNLTTGTTSPPAPNLPISGKPTTPFEPEAGRPAVLKGEDGVYVDNSYSVPGASGCQLEVGQYQVSIDKLVNAAYGLAAAAGSNEASLEFDDSIVAASVVYP
jgi:hypothetical protein